MLWHRKAQSLEVQEDQWTAKVGQLSSQNPGWVGPGIPSFRKLTFGRVHIAVLLIISKHWKGFLYLVAASFADLWHFYLRLQPRENVECLCCGWAGRAFLAKSNWRAVIFQSRCPQCDARSRHRGLAHLLPTIMVNRPDGPILFFAPELVTMNLLTKEPSNVIQTSDFKSRDVDFPGEDIQNLSFENETFAVILCNHVLEHVQNDQRALLECARVLKPGGIAIFTIPGNFRKVTTWEFSTVDSNGHFRHYGMDVVGKMKYAFRAVTPIDMSDGAMHQWHIRRGDFAFICRK